MCYREVYLIAMLISVFACGCWGPFDMYSPSRIHRMVSREAPSTYIIDYPWLAVQKEFGDDLDRSLVAYMESRGILPEECRVAGITVIAGQHLEGGGAWARFRCTAQQVGSKTINSDTGLDLR